MELRLDTPVGQLPGVGPARERKLAGLGIAAVEDLLRDYPRDYEDRRQVWEIARAPADTPACVEAMVAGTPTLSRIRRGLDLTRVRAVDASGVLELTFFNQPYRKNELKPGQSYIFYGRAEGTGSRRKMTNPVLEPVGRNTLTGRIVPVYPLTAGISNYLMLNLTGQALSCAGLLPETLPETVCRAHALLPMPQACRQAHRPEGPEELDAARRTLCFEELFLLSLGLALLKKRRESRAGTRLPPRDLKPFLDALPFPLTGAQKRTIGEAFADLSSGRQMNRLVQGDVGSGKTVVAAACVWLVCRSGYQAALMAPTEILAEQHFRTLRGLLAPMGIRVGLLTGAMTEKEKRETRAGLKTGEIPFAIGTHALLGERVEFRNLALVVTDEQHRFGVAQRAALSGKGERPHVLVMSATPIPRTLALMIYGDLDVSVIDELPSGRRPVETYLIGEDKRERLYGFVRRLVKQGRQAYLVCPMVEQGEETPEDVKAAAAYAEELREKVFPELKVGLVHGRMRPKEKDAVMRAFASGGIDVLVSTTVIEVGVDVPNAALMVVENAERFGLSQLHQLRGRVGRGQFQSYCVLMSQAQGETGRQRLKALTETSDGFRIAEKDLELRGPGDFFGARQHGLPQLQVADLTGDTRLLYEAQSAAAELLEADPELKRPENAPALRRVRRLFAENADSFN